MLGHPGEQRSVKTNARMNQRAWASSLEIEHSEFNEVAFPSWLLEKRLSLSPRASLKACAKS